MGKPPKPGREHRLQKTHLCGLQVRESRRGYLTVQEKKDYKVRGTNGGLYQRIRGENVPLANGSYRFALSPKGGLYIDLPSTKDLGCHSKFRAGQPVRCAGNLDVEDGQITYMNNHSGHYLPNATAMERAVTFLVGDGLVSPDVTLDIFTVAGLLDGRRPHRSTYRSAMAAEKPHHPDAFRKLLRSTL